MSDKINDGGPALPTITDMRNRPEWTTKPGMTLRDWFAGQALAGLIGQCSEVPEDKLASWSYIQADAMLKAREAARG